MITYRLDEKSGEAASLIQFTEPTDNNLLQFLKIVFGKDFVG
jgi:hypothetical protein